MNATAAISSLVILVAVAVAVFCILKRRRSDGKTSPRELKFNVEKNDETNEVQVEEMQPFAKSLPNHLTWKKSSLAKGHIEPSALEAEFVVLDSWAKENILLTQDNARKEENEDYNRYIDIGENSSLIISSNYRQFLQCLLTAIQST